MSCVCVDMAVFSAVRAVWPRMGRAIAYPDIQKIVKLSFGIGAM